MMIFGAARLRNGHHHAGMGASRSDDIRRVERLAATRARVSPSGVGVAVARHPPGGPLSCRASDGRLFAWVEVRPPAGDHPEDEAVAAALERHAAALPGDRLLALEAAGPLPWPLGEP
jgi:hypothetical protein